MSMRDDFSDRTKQILAERVGFRCSNPGCRKPTSGPRSDPTKTINIGVAAHITAASEGGPRYDPGLISEQRKHPDNGIWLCQNCAKLIDNDSDRYPPALLNQWKRQAEETALEDIEHGFVQRIVQVFTGPQPQIYGGLSIHTPPSRLGALLGRKGRIVTLTRAQHRRNRENLLANVKATWIDGYLRHAVHHAIYMELGLEYKRDAVSRPWDLTLQPVNQAIPLNQPIGAVFAEHGRSLLILGDPASGKTITMLQLAEELLAEAQQDEKCPIPIVLNLSSWTKERQPLTDWLVEEMLIAYQVSRPLAAAWLEAGQLSLLLDGLDEVDEACRDDCTASINEFKAGHSVDIVVCSRVADYVELSNRLNLSTAICVQPLTYEQIDAHLREFGSRLNGLRVAVSHDKELEDLAKSPLMLSLMSLVYDGLDWQQVSTRAALDGRRRDFLATYVRRVFQHRPLPKDSAYDESQALCWLTNLAQRMARHSQSAFYIERLQPTWLPPHPVPRHYRLMVGLVGGLITGLLAGLLAGSILLLSSGPVVGLTAGLACVLLVGVLGAWILVSYNELDGSGLTLGEELHWSTPSVRVVLEGIKDGFAIGLILGLLTTLLGMLSIELWDMGLLDSILDVMGGRLKVWLTILVTTEAVFAAIAGLLGGLIRFIDTVQTRQQTSPNEGIYSRLRNGLRMGSLFGLIGGLLGGLFGGLLDAQFGGRLAQLASNLLFTLIWELSHGRVVLMNRGLLSWAATGLSIGLPFGMLLGLSVYGGFAVIQHYALRFMLVRHGILPFPFSDRRLVAYLDAMADRILLRRVGGGWVFIHRYLMEYFASLGTEEAQQ